MWLCVVAVNTAGGELGPEPDQILVPCGGANSSCDFQIGVRVVNE